MDGSSSLVACRAIAQPFLIHRCGRLPGGGGLRGHHLLHRATPRWRRSGPLPCAPVDGHEERGLCAKGGGVRRRGPHGKGRGGGDREGKDLNVNAKARQGKALKWLESLYHPDRLEPWPTSGQWGGTGSGFSRVDDPKGPLAEERAAGHLGEMRHRV